MCTVAHPVALEDAFRRHYPALRAKCRRMLRDPQEADDVAQETFVRLWKSNLAGGDDRMVTAWIYKTSNRVAIDRLRASATRLRLAPPPEERSTDMAGSLEVKAQLDRLAATMPEDELELVLLQRWDGLTHAEIAEVTGQSERTVRRRLKSSEERLAQLAKES